MSDEQVLEELLKDKVKDKLESVGITANGTDEIVIIVDRSGSMARIRDEAEGGINAFMEEQGKVGKARVTIVEFDNYIKVVCDQVDSKEVPEYKLVPRGGTALLDAIGSVIGDPEKYTSKDGKTIVVVNTDGMENASKEWTRDKIFETINERKEAGWEFMFLAAGQDAIQTGMSYGFDKDSTVTYESSARGAKAASDVTSTYTTGLRTRSKADALYMKSAVVAQAAGALSEDGAIDPNAAGNKEVNDALAQIKAQQDLDNK